MSDARDPLVSEDTEAAPADRPIEADVATLAGPSSAPSGDDPTLSSDQAAHTDPPSASRPPTRIGRYVVLKPIGEGGMGLVFAAYDPELDRKVAIKLVRPALHEQAAKEPQLRLLREAQTLAKLAHPNIIHVYEVGALRDGVFIAMEYFEAPTLKRWQDQSEISWREILAAYRAAGRGLEAAHAAGLVHRDFKPHNVLVGADGQVRVIDFGLALETSTVALAAQLDDPPEAALERLTMTGKIMGTPPYMAPEQWAGKSVDARTDQFSFCVSLYEALYGERPFAGKTFAELGANVTRGIIQPPPRFERVPSWLRPALLRGLAVDPEQRYPNITELLAVLERDPAIRRRRGVLGVAAVSLAIAGAFAWNRMEDVQRARAEGERLRVEFGRMRASNAEEELHRVRTRNATQRWDDLVLAWANERVDDDPTRALASLRHLQDLDTNLAAARTIAADAWQRGVARESVELSGTALELAVTPTGDLVATLAAGGIIQAWRRGDRQQLPAWTCPEPVASLALAPHAPLLAVGSKSGSIFLVELGSQGVTSFAAHEGAVLALSFAADGSVLASAGADHAVRRWSATGERIDAMTNHDAEVVALSYDLGGTALASATKTGQLAWWNPQTAKVQKVEAAGQVVSLAAANGTVWTVARDGRVWWWRPGSQPRETANAGIASLQATADGGLILVHQNGSVTWTDGDPEIPPRPLLVGAPVTQLAYSPDDGGIWLAGPDIGVQRWDAAPDHAKTIAFEQTAGALAFSPDGSLLAIAGAAGTLKVSGLRSDFSREGTLEGRPVRASWSPNSDRLAVQMLDASVEIIDAQAPESNVVRFAWGETRESERTSTASPPSLAWTNDGSGLAFARCDSPDSCVVALLDANTGQASGHRAFAEFASTLTPNSDGSSILIGIRDKARVVVLDVDTAEYVESKFIANDQRILGQAWSEEGDGRVRIATASDDTLRVWSWQPTSGQYHRILEESGFSQMQPSEDASAVYLDSGDKLAVLWSIAGTRFMPGPELPGGVEHIRLSDDGRILLARGRNDDGVGFTFVFDLAIGQGRRLPQLLDPVALSVDGVVADYRHGPGVRIWDEPTPEDAAGFRAWLEQATTIEVPLEAFRGG
jgi:WD40 repeat protein